MSSNFPDQHPSRETFAPMSTWNVRYMLLLYNFEYNTLSLRARTTDVQTVHVFKSSTESKQREMLGCGEIKQCSRSILGNTKLNSAKWGRCLGLTGFGACSMPSLPKGRLEQPLGCSDTSHLGMAPKIIYSFSLFSLQVPSARLHGS